MKTFRLFIVLFPLFALLGTTAQPLATAPYLCDSMVLQRGRPLPLTGTARPGSSVEVSFAGHTVAARTDPQGKWQATLPALSASDRNRTMTIRCGDELREIHGVLVGEVWLAGGQSNMAFKVRSMESEDRLALLRTADCPAIRCYYRAPIVSGGKKLDASDRPWSGAHGRNVDDWSAIAYVFARELHRALGVPIGFINCTHGGSTAEAWISAEAFETDSALKNSVAKIYDGIDSLYKNPSVLHEQMLSRFDGLTVRGVIWYQGESNGLFPDRYGPIFSGLIAGWRRFFNNDRLPFIFAQLPFYRVPNDRSGECWARLRQAQLETARTIPHTSLVVTADCGNPDDIHPKNKYPVGMRFAAAAKRQVYHAKTPGALTLSEPVATEHGTIEIAVGGIRNGLVLHGKKSGFELRDAEGVWHPARLCIRKKRLELTADRVPAPSGVRYAWGNVDTLTVYHTSGLPLPPFLFEIKP